MLEYILEPFNAPFAVALAVIIGIAILEGISTLFGAALSGLLDTLLPDPPDFADPMANVDIDIPDGEAPYALSRFFSWLRVGEVPVLMLIVVFLTAFGLIGLALQSSLMHTIGYAAPGWLASIPTVLLSLPVVRFSGGILARIMPSDETEAVSADSLIGRVAVVTIGKARKGRPAEARVVDSFGTTHLLMVEPDLEDDQFSAGASVLLVKRESSVFKVITPPSSTLTDS